MGNKSHFVCCDAPVDLGHMFGCPNSPENAPTAEELAAKALLTIMDDQDEATVVRLNRKLVRIREVLYPDGDPDHEWAVEDLETIAEIINEEPTEVDDEED